MSPDKRDLRDLRLLVSMPFLDRLDLFAVSAWSRGSTYDAASRLERIELVNSVRHATNLIVPTRRFSVTAPGRHYLAEEDDVGIEELLRFYLVPSQWRRVLLRRLDAVGVIYLVASAIAHVAGPIRFRWYRGLPLDAAVSLSDGRTIGLVRQGATSNRSAFAKRLWRLIGEPAAWPQSGLPHTFLVLVSDPVRLHYVRRLLRDAPVRANLATEEEAAGAGPYEQVWRAPNGSAAVDLDRIVIRAKPGGRLPREPRPLRASLPVDADLHSYGGDLPDHLLRSAFKPADKRTLDALADWPWIVSHDLEGLLGVSGARMSHLTARLRLLGLVSAVPAGTRHRLCLSDRRLTLLARRDRSAVGAALKRWSLSPIDPQFAISWRNVTGTHSRQLIRNLEHTEAVHQFIAALCRQARTSRIYQILQIDPPHRAAR